MNNGLRRQKPISFYQDRLVTIRHDPEVYSRCGVTLHYLQRNLYGQPLDSTEGLEVEILESGSIIIHQGPMDPNGKVIHDWNALGIYIYPEVVDAFIAFLEQHRDEIGVQVATAAEKTRQEAKDAGRRPLNPDNSGSNPQEEQAPIATEILSGLSLAVTCLSNALDGVRPDIEDLEYIVSLCARIRRSNGNPNG